MSVQLANAEELAELRQWLSKIPYIPIHLCDDNTLQRFYIHRKGNIADTKRNIINYFKNYMTVYKEMCILDMNAQGAKDFARISNDFILPGRARDGSLITYTHILPPFMKDVTLQSIVQYRRRMWTILWGFPPKEQKFTVIFSAKDQTMALHLKHFNLELYASCFPPGLKSLPYSVGAIHIIHLSPLLDALGKKVMLIMSEKLRDRVHFHSTPETLHKFIAKENLPSDLGGDLPSCQELHDEGLAKDLERFNDKLLEVQEFLLEHHGKHGDILGETTNTATFRKLEID